VSTPQAPAATPTAEERNWGMLAHLSSFAGLLLPGGSVVGPLLIWRARRERSVFVAEQAKEALNFNISVLLATAICIVLALVSIGILLGAVLLIYWLVITIVAAIKSGEGINYRYRFSLRLVK
jgi:uncharacterized Tic20 family protein